MSHFDPGCSLCPRLSSALKKIRHEYPDYHARPVAPFGSASPSLLIVGLAPGLHGANATGRPFTGDYAGILLYETLHAFGFASHPVSEHAGDRLKLKQCRITNAVKCWPPANKPLPDEINTCNRYLQTELNELDTGAVILALGRIAHQAVLKAFNLKQKDYPFGHGQEHRLPEQRRLLDSYHCSRYNTQTGRLTPKMFQEIFCRIREIMDLSD